MKQQTKESAIIITKHAFKRAKSRLSFTTDALKKMATKAYYLGIKPTNAKGFLAQYLEKLWLSEEMINNSRIYGEILYLFADNILITLYPIPSALKKLVKISTLHEL